MKCFEVSLIGLRIVLAIVTKSMAIKALIIGIYFFFVFQLLLSLYDIARFLYNIAKFLTTPVVCLLIFLAFFNYKIFKIWLIILFLLFNKLVVIISKLLYRIFSAMIIAIVSQISCLRFIIV